LPLRVGERETQKPFLRLFKRQDAIRFCLFFCPPHEPAKTAYNLFFAPDYSTQARAVLTTWFETRWPKHKDYGKRKPRFACVYAFPSPYASAPIKAIKDHALMLGFEIGDDQDVALTSMDTKSQIMALQKFKPDVCWHGNTTMCVSATMRDAYASASVLTGW